MSDIGMVLVETGEGVGQEESAQNHASYMSTKDLSKMAKTILMITAMMGLGSNGAKAMEQNNDQCKMDANGNRSSSETFWIWFFIFLLSVLWLVFWQ